MKVSFTSKGIHQASWRDYAVRFLFGGGLTALTGVVAHRYGPSVGGLFLAFPAILPASLTLLASHQRERKAKLGLNGAVRGGRAAALDALGATFGGVGLLLFAVITWQLLPRYRPHVVLSLATVVWAMISYGVWRLRKL
jgi:hypothetical protein